MSPTHTRKRAGSTVTTSAKPYEAGAKHLPGQEIPAAEIERIVIEQIRSLLQTPEIIVQTWRAARKADKDVTEMTSAAPSFEFEPIWNELFPAEQARIVELLVERIDLSPTGSTSVCGSRG